MSAKSTQTDPGEFDTLAAAWLDGRATPEQAERLGEIIVASPEARDKLLALAELHACLAIDTTLWNAQAEPLRDRSVRRRISVGWAMAASATCMICGLLGASVWAMSAPQFVATVGRVTALVDGGFESQVERLPSGFPRQFGAWSGDLAAIVDGGKLRPAEGQRLLRFERAEREPGLPDRGAASCDVYQLVDLRALKKDATGEASLELSVQFRDARTTADGEPVKFICRLYTFAGTPESLGAEWPITQKEALATGSGSFDSTGGTPETWHSVSTKVLLTPQADFAIVHLVAHRPKHLAGTVAEFGEQYADDVRLTLKTQPVLPVRVGQR